MIWPNQKTGGTMELDIIYNSECIEGMKKIPEESVDLIICDLPYGTTNCSWDTVIPFKKLWKQYLRIAKKDCPIVLFGSEPFSTLLRMSNLKDYKYDWYWEKNAPTGFVFAKTQPMRDIETISVFCKGKPIYQPQGVYRLSKPVTYQRTPTGDSIYREEALSKKITQEFSGYPKNVLKFKKDKNTWHPTQKPLDLFEYLIKTYSKPGDIVLDNCMGSGTTAVACINTDRHFIGFELNETYYVQMIDRIQSNSTQLTLFDN